MSYIPLIQRSDFNKYVKIGVNIKDTDLDVHIRDAQELDFLSWCDTPFYDKLLALGTSTNQPELLDLLNNYIKPYLVCAAYYKYLLWSGRDVTTGGIRVQTNGDSVDIGDKGRAELIADILRKQNAYLAKLTFRLDADEYTYDNIIYTFYDENNKKEPSPNIGIKRVGKVQRYYDKTSKKWL